MNFPVPNIVVNMVHRVGDALSVLGGGSSSNNPSPESTPQKSTSSRGKEDMGKGKRNGEQGRGKAGQGSLSGGGRGGGGGGRDPWEEAGKQKYQKPETRRQRLKRVAETTLQAIRKGSYEYRGAVIPLKDGIKHSVDATVFYPENSTIADWKNKLAPESQARQEATISILNISTLDAAKILESSYRFQTSQTRGAPSRTGVLNFASATDPGGGFQNGADAQEESIARVSTLFPSLKSKGGKKFYEAQSHGRPQYYTHSMIWSPGVVVFQNDYAEGVKAYRIEVVSSAAVNAGRILDDKRPWQTAQVEIEIEGIMKERMGRILYLFEIQGVRNIVLGTFGTGVFKNKISEVARIWAELLVLKDSRFRYSFDRVIFAVTGDSTFAEFKGRFEGWTKQKDTARPATGGSVYVSPF